MKITSKSEFFRLWELGVLGNRTNLWRNVDDALKTNIPIFGIRQIGKTGGGKWQLSPRGELIKTIEEWEQEGRKFIIDDGCPDWCRTLQGEICRTHRGLEGYLDTVAKLPMRPAMTAGHMLPRTGAAIIALLDKFMDPSSRDDLYDLLDLYPDATVEFSCFGIDVGILPNRNTLFWEIRNY